MTLCAVVAMAYGRDLNSLSFAGVMGMWDPPREKVARARVVLELLVHPFYETEFFPQEMQFLQFCCVNVLYTVCIVYCIHCTCTCT